jgi:hypothetical protein
VDLDCGIFVVPERRVSTVSLDPTLGIHSPTIERTYGVGRALTVTLHQHNELGTRSLDPSRTVGYLRMYDQTLESNSEVFGFNLQVLGYLKMYDQTLELVFGFNFQVLGCDTICGHDS